MIYIYIILIINRRKVDAYNMYKKTWKEMERASLPTIFLMISWINRTRPIGETRIGKSCMC